MSGTGACPHCGEQCNLRPVTDGDATVVWCQSCYRVFPIGAADGAQDQGATAAAPDTSEPEDS